MSCFSESWEDCGKREVEEETGLKLTKIHYSTVVNAIVPTENYHYVTLFVQGHVDPNYTTEPINLEPDKCEGDKIILVIYPVKYFLFLFYFIRFIFF